MIRPILIVTRGLPASGKTTLALEKLRQEPERWARVNRDALREHTFGIMPMLSPAGEQNLTKVQTWMIRSLFQAGLNVVADDTNLPEARMKGWEEFARWNHAALEVWDLRDIPVETCLDRDRARIARGERGVGDDVILRLAQYLPAKETS